MKPYVYFGGATFLSVLTYSAGVEFNYKQKGLSKESPFRLGSADSLVMDNLNTGDVLLFSRKWYNYHIPTAAMILFYKYAFGSEFDHGAIVIVDNSGAANVLERTPFGGIKYRPFENRITSSLSEQIVLLPITPSLPVRSSEIVAAIDRVAENQKLDTTGEVLYFFRSIFTHYLSGSLICCPSTALIFNMYGNLGYIPNWCVGAAISNSDSGNDSASGRLSKSSSSSSGSSDDGDGSSNNRSGVITSDCNLTHFYSRNIHLVSATGKNTHAFLSHNIFIRMR